ncbi:MAG: histidine kinase [Bacteroidales bacterium]|nr:histidine kinase [Bacteroidales bacterium]
MKHFTTSNGLPSNEVFHVMQDSTGYIWFCTNNGVSRYDGYEFDNFSDAEGVAGNAILFSYQDYRERIWFVSLGGKLSYYTNDSIYEFKWNQKIQDNINGSPLPLKRGIYVDSADNVFLATRPQGIYKISNNGDINFWNSHPPSRNYIMDFGPKAICSSIRDRADSISLIKDSKVQSKIEFKPSIKPPGLSLINKVGKEHYILSMGFQVMEIQNNKLENLHYDGNKYITEFQVSEEGGIWLGYKNNGIELYNSKSFNEKRKHYLEGKAISTVLRSKQGGLWFTTLKNGVYYKPSKEVISIDEQDLLSTKHVNYSFVDKNGKLIIGTADNYINIIDNFNTNTSFESRQIELNKSEPDNNTFAISDQEYTYFGTDQGLFVTEIYSYNSINKVSVFDIEHKFEKTGVKSLLRLSDGSYAMGNATGYFTSTINELHNDTLFVKQRNSERTSCLLFDSSNNCIWIGCLNGLKMHDLRSDTVLNVSKGKECLDRRIVDIEILPGNRLAMATKGNGLIFYDISKDTCSRINTHDGLMSNSVLCLELNDNILWVGTNEGIGLININSEKQRISILDKAYGLASNEINDFTVHDSMMIVSTSKGVSYLNLNALTFKRRPSKIHIKTINVPNQKVISEPGNKFEIKYPQNSLRLKYTTLTYNHEQDLTYKYRLRGLKESWKRTSRNEIFFSYIPPGDYTFEIMVRNKNGIWSENPHRVEFTVEPPLWGKQWFITLLVITLTLVIASILYLLFRNYKIKTQAKQDIIRYQHQALSSQMNPHFLFNSLNSIHRYILESNSSHASKFLSKFARLTRLFLKNSQNHRIPISKELESIRLYLQLENLRMKNKFDYTFEIDDNIDISNIEIPSMLLQPIVENAIIHGIRYLHTRRGKIEIAIKKKEQYLQFIIKDNGVGRDKAAEIEQKNLHHSFGNSIILKRIELLNQLHNSFISLNYIDLYEGNQGVGTKVVLENFPITYSNVENTDS